MDKENINYCKLLIFILFLGILPVHQLDAQSTDVIFKYEAQVYETSLTSIPNNGELKRIPIRLPQYKRALFFSSIKENFNFINQMFSWPVQKLTEIFHYSGKLKDGVEKPQNCGMLLVLELEDNHYALIQPLCTDEAMSWIEINNDDEIDVVCGTMGTKAVEIEKFPAFAYGKHKDLYRLLSDIWHETFNHKDISKNASLRSEKQYPEMFDYLGWCSWEHFHKNINETNLCQAIDKIEASEVPVRWILVDDGHQNEEKSRLINFELNAKKFPNGWRPIIQKRSDKIKWMGLWHCMYGLWGGISSHNDMHNLKPYLIKNKSNRVMLNGTGKAANEFYKDLVASGADSDFDFLKVDVQTSDFLNYVKMDNPVRSHHNNAAALEYYSHKRMKGLMNCMAMNLPCLLNTKYSATTRVSMDYFLNSTPDARVHIYESFQNTPWIGQFLYPDHDMFHSSDNKYGQLMAISKAMSMAPVYLSDYPTDFKMQYITPLVDKEGKLFKPLAPGVPLPSSFFDNVIQKENCYQVIAPLSKHSAAIVSYHLCSQVEKSMRAVIRPQDYTFADAMVQPYPGLRDLPQEGLVYYDWHKRKGGVLKKNYSFDLEKLSDRLVLLCEIEKGWAIVGDTDKYLSTTTVESYKVSESKLSITMKENVNFLIYSKSPIVRCEQCKYSEIGDDFYLIQPFSSNKTCKIYR